MKTLLVTTALSFLACIAQAQDDPHAGHHAETVKKAAPQGFLGIAMNFENGKVTIRHVEPGSPADKAGLKAGDIIVKAGDTVVGGDQSRVVEAVQAKHAGDTLEIQCQRGDKEVTVRVELGSRPGGTAEEEDNTLRQAVEASEKALQKANRESRNLQKEIREMKDKVAEELNAPDPYPHGTPRKMPPTVPGQLQKLAPEIEKDPFRDRPLDLRLKYSPAPMKQSPEPHDQEHPLPELNPFQPQPGRPPMLEQPKLPKIPGGPGLAPGHEDPLPPGFFHRTTPVPPPRGRITDRDGRPLRNAPVQNPQSRKATEDAVWRRAHKALVEALNKSEAAPGLKQEIIRGFEEARRAASAEMGQRARMEAEAARLEKESAALKARAEKLRGELQKAAE